MKQFLKSHCKLSYPKCLKHFPQVKQTHFKFQSKPCIITGTLKKKVATNQKQGLQTSQSSTLCFFSCITFYPSEFALNEDHVGITN